MKGEGSGKCKINNNKKKLIKEAKKEQYF